MYFICNDHHVDDDANSKEADDVDELVYVMLYVATGEDLQCPAVPGVCLKI